MHKYRAAGSLVESVLYYDTKYLWVLRIKLLPVSLLVSRIFQVFLTICAPLV
jgi:hypothetical protein